MAIPMTVAPDVEAEFAVGEVFCGDHNCLKNMSRHR